MGSSAPAPVPSFVPTTELQPASPIPEVDGWTGALQMPQGMSTSLIAPAQANAITEQVQSLSIHDLTLTQIATLGAEVEIELHRSLGAFLDRIDKRDAPQIFRLVTELNTAVKAEDLDGLAEQIMNGKPGLMDRMLGMLSGKKLAEARNALFENLQLMVAGKTKKLGTVIDTMEKQIEVEKQKALEEARNLEKLKDNYRTRFSEFVMATVFLSTMLAKGRQELAALTAAQARGEHTGSMTVQEAQDKVQALESRALAVESVFTKLPAEQLVVTQIQTATIQTVQEVTTTTAGRFASIKMTLLAIHGAMSVQNLQRVVQQGADLDKNLSNVRDRLVKNVATTAANAPGDNRLAQAKQLQDVTKNVRELVDITEKARVDNQAKFDQARAMLVQARTDLTALGAVIRPDKEMKF